jgi:hypothetical protein
VNQIMLPCAACGDTVLVVKSIAGQPWVVECDNGHPWILFGGDVIITIDWGAQLEASRR